MLSFHSEVCERVRMSEQFPKTALSVEARSAEGAAALDAVSDTDIRELFDVAQVDLH